MLGTCCAVRWLLRSNRPGFGSGRLAQRRAWTLVTLGEVPGSTDGISFQFVHGILLVRPAAGIGMCIRPTLLSPFRVRRVSSFSALSWLITSWKFWAKLLIIVSQIHLSVSLPPVWRCWSNWVEIFLIHRCILGPLRYPKKSMVWDIVLCITLVCLLIPWYTLQLVMNSSTLSRSPVKISGSFPIILSDNAPWLAAFLPPAGSGLPPPPLPPPRLGSSPPPPPPDPPSLCFPVSHQ